MRAHSKAVRIVAAASLLALATATVPAAAQLRLKGLGGETLDEAMLARGVVIAVVWASWSPRGRDVVERVGQIERRWGSRALVVMINFQEDEATVSRFLAGKDVSVPVFLDSGNADFSKRYNVTRVPRLLVFKDGVTAVNVNLPDDPDAVIVGVVGG